MMISESTVLRYTNQMTEKNGANMQKEYENQKTLIDKNNEKANIGNYIKTLKTELRNLKILTKNTNNS